VFLEDRIAELNSATRVRRAVEVDVAEQGLIEAADDAAWQPFSSGRRTAHMLQPDFEASLRLLVWP
jgi:hypothetical protein